MDDERLGALLRVLRVRRGLRQADVSRLAGVSDQTISRIERGQLASLSVTTLRTVARVLEGRLDLRLWTRAGEVERMASANHAALVEALVLELRSHGWVVRPEVSFNLDGERGLVDVVAWNLATRTLLLIEVKTEIVDVGELVGTFDRKRRLGPRIGRTLGLDSESIAAALVVADTRTNHRRVQAHAATFGATLPDGGQRFRAFLARPSGSLAAVAFWPLRHPGSARPLPAGVRRVRRRVQPGVRPASSVERRAAQAAEPPAGVPSSSPET